MAINWNVKSFVNVMVKGGEEAKIAVHDCGKRFPLAVNAVSTIIASSNDRGVEAFVKFADACPDFLTMRKIESVLKDGIASEAEEEEVEEKTEKKEKKAKAEKKEKKAKKEKAEKKASKKAKKAKKEEDEEEEDEVEEAEADEDEDDEDSWDI